MFRIDRSYVNLGATRFVRVDSEEGTEADAIGEPLNAAASATYMADLQAQEIIGSAHKKAEEIIQEARDEVADIMVKARDEAEEQKRAAWNEGYAEGAVEGKHSYDEKLAAKIREDDEMLKNVVNEIYDERERTYSGLEDEVVGLALEIVRKVINPAEETIGGVFESLIRNALKQIAPDGKVVIRVSSTEYERFFSSGSATIELESGVTVKASVLRDASLGGGDVVIDTENETVNAGLNSQLKYIALAFEKMVV